LTGLLPDCLGFLLCDDVSKCPLQNCILRYRPPDRHPYTSGQNSGFLIYLFFPKRREKCLIDDRTGFTVHNNMGCRIEQRLKAPSSVFTAEILAIRTALSYILSNPRGRYIIFTDSLSSLMALDSRKISCNTHPCILQCKQIYYDLQNSGHDVTLSWVPAHMGILGNEIADEMAKNASSSENVSDIPPFPNYYKKISKQNMLQQWQIKWTNSNTGRLTHSIFPKIQTKPWFADIQEERGFVSTISRIMTGHSSVRSHLHRFNIVDNPICVCQENYETVDHLLWECSRCDRQSVIDELTLHNIDFGTPIRDICAQRKWDALKKKAVA
jgi:ribonuclease HI